MPKIRLLAVLNTEKITKNQPVVSGHAPCRQLISRKISVKVDLPVLL